MLQTLGFDTRFKYPNVQVNNKYHIVLVKKPERQVMDFAPVMLSCSGVPGSNFMHRFDMGNHQIVDSNLE